MEKFKNTALSIDNVHGNSYVIEGEDLYYYINERPQNGNFDTVWPCPIAQVAGRFRHNWILYENNLGSVREDLVRRIKQQQKDPEFQELCKQKKEDFGKKSFD